MTNYLAERLYELRTKYKQTGDSKWLHRYNECKHIFAKLILDQNTSTQAPKRSQGRSTSPSTDGHTSTDNDRGLV